jgi:hypothetical protein
MENVNKNTEVNNTDKKLIISDVSVSLLVPLKTLEEWIDTIDSMEYSLNQRLYVNDNIREFIKNYKNNEH